jgi:hypothetical protein
LIVKQQTKRGKSLALELDWAAMAKANRAPLSKEQRGILKKHVADAVFHFNQDGWPLAYSLMMNRLYHDLLGFNPEWEFLSRVAKKIGKVEIADEPGAVTCLRLKRAPRSRSKKS